MKRLRTLIKECDSLEKELKGLALMYGSDWSLSDDIVTEPDHDHLYRQRRRAYFVYHRLLSQEVDYLKSLY